MNPKFEVQIKYGNRWTYKGIYAGSTPKAAALNASFSTGRKVIRVRPEDSRDKWLVYRFKEIATLDQTNNIIIPHEFAV